MDEKKSEGEMHTFSSGVAWLVPATFRAFFFCPFFFAACCCLRAVFFRDDAAAPAITISESSPHAGCYLEDC